MNQFVVLRIIYILYNCSFVGKWLWNCVLYWIMCIYDQLYVTNDWLYFITLHRFEVFVAGSIRPVQNNRTGGSTGS